MKIDNALTRIVTVGMITALVTNSLLAVAHATTPLSGEYDCQTGLLSSDDRSTYTVTNGDVSFGNDCAGILVIPAGVTSIGDSAFNSASGLTSITIPTSVTSIGSGAFFGATGLASIYFRGKAPASVGGGAFYGVANGAKAHISAIASGFGTDTSWNGLVVERVVLKIRAATKVKPNIIGTAKVSRKLNAKKGEWIGNPTPVISYQWYACTARVKAVTATIPRTCKTISRATKSTLTVIKSHRRKYLAVRVVGKGTGTLATKWLSKSTAKVK